VIKKRYQSYNELLDYCSNSANPVGRLMLQLFDVRNEAAALYSDKICTALQITNFLQDINIDYNNGRIYFPQEELSYFMVEESAFKNKDFNDNFRELMKFNVERTYKLYEQGKNIQSYLKGRIRLEIKWTVAGGEEVLNKIRKIDYNVFRIRPSLNKKDFIRLFLRSIL
jgi:phytoene/squalene synthetase